MATTQKHPRMLEAIAMAKAASQSTKGMYPVTKAEYVIKQDGTPMETPPVTEDEEPSVDTEET